MRYEIKAKLGDSEPFQTLGVAVKQPGVQFYQVTINGKWFSCANSLKRVRAQIADFVNSKLQNKGLPLVTVVTEKVGA